jgi:peptidoglycan/LPS O-acetylase OafA/YrhL
VVVILSIIILGPIVTSLSVDKYFMSRDTWLYLSNIFLYARFSLPGVFTDNFYPNVVNGSLWSLTIEFIMYLLLLVLAIYSKNTKYLFILITLVFCIIRVTIIDKIDRNIVVYGADIRQIFICGVYFMVGICFERYRIDKYFNIYSFCIIFIVWYSLSNFQNLFFIASFFCLPFLCLAFGASNWLLLSIFSKNDYSYGIYIYAFPIQQLVSYYFDGISFISYLLLTICIIIIFAVLSWHLVEKPFLLLKQRLLI